MQHLDRFQNLSSPSSPAHSKFHAAQLKQGSSAGGRNLNDDFEQAATGLLIRDITDEEQEHVNKQLARWVAFPPYYHH